MGYLLDIARNGHKPLNGSEWGSEEAKKEIEENLKLAEEAKFLNEDLMDAQYAAVKDVLSAFLKENKSAILKAIEKGTHSAIDSLEAKEEPKSLMQQAKEALKSQGYSEREIALMESSAKIFCENAPWKNRDMN